MITDTIEHATLYYRLGPGVKVALEYLAQAELLEADPGRHELDAGCCAIVQDYRTAPRGEKRWEAHRKYIDVQYLASGVELIGYADRSSLSSTDAYDDANDIEWFEGEGSFIRAQAGTFAVLFPHDAHMPGVAPGTPGPVRKVVVKVPVER